jgi:putative Mg2+ transporter-C (MgtC) family protein
MIVFNQVFDAPFLVFIAKIALAMLLGIVLGIERIYAHKNAGMRTYALVSMSAAFFVLIAQSVVATTGTPLAIDAVARMASQIIVGVGFLGTGLIIFKDGHIENLTTAAGMWACAGIGMAVGFGMFREALFVTVLTFFVLGILSFVERAIRLRVFPEPVAAPAVPGAPEKKPRKPRAVKAKVRTIPITQSE